MDNEEKLNKEIEMYRQLAAKDKDVDVAGLMIQALNKNTNLTYLSIKQKRIGYIVSLALPPFGLFYALRFYFSEADDGKDAAIACVALTAFSIFCALIIFKSMFSTSTVDQIKQINPQDVKSLLE